MNQQTNGKVDTKIAEDIFAELDDSGDGVVQLDEFVQNYFDKQTQIKERIVALEENIQNHHKQKNLLMQKLKELKPKQKQNRFGLDDDSVLSVRVVEARDLMPMDISGKSDPYCMLNFGTQSQKTNFIKQDLNPVWNEIFALDVESGKEVMKVEVFDKDDFGRDDFLGSFSFNLDKYRD